MAVKRAEQMRVDADRMLKSPVRSTRNMGRALKAELETEELLKRLSPEDRHALRQVSNTGIQHGQEQEDIFTTSYHHNRAIQRMARLILEGAGEAV